MLNRKQNASFLTSTNTTFSKMTEPCQIIEEKKVIKVNVSRTQTRQEKAEIFTFLKKC